MDPVTRVRLWRLVAVFPFVAGYDYLEEAVEKFADVAVFDGLWRLLESGFCVFLSWVLTGVELKEKR